MECPLCRLINPASSGRCDCGYNFKTQSMEELSRPDLPDGAALRLLRLWIGFVLAALSLITSMIEIALNPALAEAGPFIGFYLLFAAAGMFYWLWCVYLYHDIVNSIPGYR